MRPSDYTIEVVLDRLRRRGDLFEPVLHGGQALGPARKKLAGLD